MSKSGVSTNETEKEIRPTAHSQMEIKKILLVLLLIIISQSHTNFEQNLFSREHDLPSSSTSAVNNFLIPNLKTSNFPPQRSLIRSSGSTILDDIRSHLRSSYGRQYESGSLRTTIHETTHGIQADLRNRLQSQYPYPINALYLLNNQYIVLKEPPIKKSNIKVPYNLRFSRYTNYITFMRGWENTPLYIFDEWNSYINGGKGALELYVTKNQYPPEDCVGGALEMSVYGVYLAKTIKERAPSYLKDNPQFINFLLYGLKESFKNFRQAKNNNIFQGFDYQDAIWNQYHNKNSDLYKTLVDIIGQKNADQVLAI